MNLVTHRLAQLTVFTAVAAAGFTVGAAHGAGAPLRIIELPRVTVVAHRVTDAASATPKTGSVPVVELPRVRVVARRMTPSSTPTFVAERATRQAGV